MKMKNTVLVTAYAVNPIKGSEDGIAWNIIKGLAAQNEIVAITRENNEPYVEKHLEEHPLPGGYSLRFEYFDLPYWMRFWKKGSRGASIYHILWHFGVVFFILKKRIKFDLAHHLNFNADWSPSFLYLLGKPYVWGPIGHHHKIPKDYILPHGKKAWLKDRLMWWVKSYFWKIDPFLKLTKWNAKKIIGLNTSVFEVMKVAKNKQVVIPAAGNELPDEIRATIKNKTYQVLSIGRFVPLKGFDITLQAFAECYHRQSAEVQAKMQLTLIGKGPEKDKLKSMAEKNLPADAVQFVDWLGRAELDEYFAASQIFLFPSHEGAGMVVPEALSFGLPVVCFDNYGPGEFVDAECAITVPYSNYQQSIIDFSLALEELLKDENRRLAMSKNAKRKFQNTFTWKKKASQIQSVYDEVFYSLQGAPATKIKSVNV